MVQNGEGYIELSTNPTEPETSSSGSNVSNTELTDSQIKLILLRLGVVSDDNYTSVELDDIVISRQAEYMIDKISKLGIDDAISILRDSLVEHNGDVNFLSEDYHLLERLVSMIPKENNGKQKEEHNAMDQKERQSGIDIKDGREMDKNTMEVPPDQEDREVLSHFKNKVYLQIKDWNLQSRLEASLIRYHSPYPEIRSITDPFDDQTIPVETLRVYVIGLFWTFIGSIVNNFFIHRMPSIGLGSHTIQILLLPSGRLWEKYMPELTIEIFGYSIELNPGPWTYKEMMLSSIIYLCSASTPYLIYNIFVMKLDKFYGLKWVTITFQVLLTISTQCLGFGSALLMKKVCVYPSKAIWPTILPTIALNRALMEDDFNNEIYGWRISRYGFFCITFVGSFLYNLVPGYFFTALSTFNWPTWISPNNIHLTNITGSRKGLGFNPIPSFDWNIIDAGCLTIPFYSYANRYLGSMLGFFVILAVYYSNNKWTGYFPINSNKLYDNKGKIYDVHKILDDNSAFSNEKYQQMGPPYFSAANLVLYGAYFAMYPFAIIYNFVTEWDSMKSSFANVFYTLVDSFRSKKHSQFGKYSQDPHCEMMAKYEDVPDWWFLLVLFTSTLFAILCITLYPTETPIWGIFFTIFINFIFLIPITSIASVTGFSFGLNVLVELIVGYTIPNSGIALITLKSFGYNIDSQASSYITDQKLAHYTKLPPRSIFRGQLISTLLNIVVALTIANWQLNNITDICDPNQKDKLTCPNDNTYFYSSIQYGEIGPAKVFSGPYPVLKWCFLLGVILVIPCVWFKNNGPSKLTKYFQPTIILGGFLTFAPYNLLYYTGGLYVSFTFMYYIKKHYLLWWEKYNYILTSALSAGVAFSSLLMFFTLQYNSEGLDWWGNTIFLRGVEGGKGRKSWLNAKDAQGGYVGLRKGEYP